MQLCRLIYCSLIALHVSSDVFAHHQEHLNCIYSFWYYPRMSMPADHETSFRFHDSSPSPYHKYACCVNVLCPSHKLEQPHDNSLTLSTHALNN